MAAELWLFNQTHKAENIGTVELLDHTAFPPQSMRHYIIP